MKYQCEIAASAKNHRYRATVAPQASSVRALLACLIAASLFGCGSADKSSDAAACASSTPCVKVETVSAQVVAVGIPGAGAIRQVGAFLQKSPIASNAAFAPSTAPGQMLAPDRWLVASTSNLGAPMAREDQLPGAIVSIAMNAAGPVVVPPSLAAPGGQASTDDGSAQLFAAQSADFLNATHHADALTANFTSVSRPLGISINNAFGRPWFANAPNAADGEGTISVVDPDGKPLAAMVSMMAGGVFAGEKTDRETQLIPGSLLSDTVGTALLGPSPDGTGKAVFAALSANGTLAQVHVISGVDGLAEEAVIASIETAVADLADSADVTRAGIIFNWVPSKTLFMTDPLNNAVVAVHLTQDDAVFRVTGMDTFTSAYLDDPIDLAPVVTETASPDFASGSTLAGGSDFYVANRGNGTVVRMTQDGQVVAIRKINVTGLGELAKNRLNGIATTGDASQFCLTVSGVHPDFPEHAGFVIQVGSFGAASP